MLKNTYLIFSGMSYPMSLDYKLLYWWDVLLDMIKESLFYQALLEKNSVFDGKALFMTRIDSPLGPMLSIVDEDYVYLLEFIERKGLENEILNLRKRLKIGIIPGRTKITDQIERELNAYFDGYSFDFETPCFLLGSDFQKKVWGVLKTIPPGETWSYLELAKAVGNSKACRAVANANGKNQLALIIPCHRVINTNGAIGGYGGGVGRKEWLIAHEQKDKY